MHTESAGSTSTGSGSKPGLKQKADLELDADVIDDDYDSYDEIFSQIQPIQQKQQKQPQTGKYTTKTASKQTRSKPKRFLLSDKSGSSTPTPTPTGTAIDTRPWAQRFAPIDLSELAVHKRKVSDVQCWLDDVFQGRRREKLLVLRGPAGCGKTTTISLLAHAMNYDIIEWRNPPVSENPRDYVSSSALFEEFLARGDRFAGLDLSTPSEQTESQHESSTFSHRILLIEEFPTVLTRNSSSLSSFRASLQRYLAATTQGTHPPIVMIISETLLSSASSISENLTLHRLLGPSLYNHPATTIIDFNSIATTFMQKALQTILEKESRSSNRTRIPGPAVLSKIAEIGDIRSAISSLEFLCLRGDDVSSNWGGDLSKKKTRSRNPNLNSNTLTSMERESLELISQRESSLGMFHAVGKIVYNKRLDESLVEDGSDLPKQPPEHLSIHRRKVTQVDVNDLVDETGTDISTFISALHENYPASCDGPEFTNSLNECIESLSDSDILLPGRSSRRGGLGGTGTSFNSGIDMLRQEEMGFQVACRGLLFGLPYPVKRRINQIPGEPRRDAHKMMYPVSLRLWKKIEEVDGLVDSWMKSVLSSSGISSIASAASTGGGRGGGGGVSAWKNRRVGIGEEAETTMMRRDDVLLDQLPYLVQIKREGVEILQRITCFRGDFEDDIDEQQQTVQQIVQQHQGDEGPEEKLILSDDDIVD